MSGASERANERASCPVLTSEFLAILDHSEQWRAALPDQAIAADAPGELPKFIARRDGDFIGDGML